MPIYSYRCSTCDHQFDIRQRMSDEPLTICPNCDGEIRRVVNSVGVVFKGSGFYVTDNRNGKSGKVSSTEKSTITSSTSTETPKSEGKEKPKVEAKTTS